MLLILTLVFFFFIVQRVILQNTQQSDCDICMIVMHVLIIIVDFNIALSYRQRFKLFSGNRDSYFTTMTKLVCTWSVS